jgi:hypothetical protein
LAGWAIADTNWFGFDKRMRILEEVIADYSPLFVLGELVSIGDHIADRQAAFTERLRAIKANPAIMAAADTNHDGTFDAEEWDAFRAKQEAIFLQEELAKRAAMPNEESMLVKAPGNAPFVVSTQSEQELVRSYQWLAPLAMVGGIASSAFGSWLALMDRWSPLFIIGFVAVGFVIGGLIKQLNVTSIIALRR